jgi:hypothetical protein
VLQFLPEMWDLKGSVLRVKLYMLKIDSYGNAFIY